MLKLLWIGEIFLLIEIIQAQQFQRFVFPENPGAAAPPPVRD